MKIKNIILNQINYTIPDTAVSFKDLKLQFDQKKIGLIGDNGVGKTTLLKLIVGDLQSFNGEISLHGTIEYCAQIPVINPGAIVADALGISEKLKALDNITEGIVNPHDYDVIDNDWNILERTRIVLDKLGMPLIEATHAWEHLSGGQKTKVQLAKILLSKKDFLILDEPTNNLDKTSRRFLYNFIKHTNQGVIIVSHDRQLLDMMDEIFELTTIGVNCYGGNYEFYKSQKTLHDEALMREFNDAKVSLQSKKRSIQQLKEKREQKQSQGRKDFQKGNVDKLTANSKKGRSEKTDSRLSKQGDKTLEQAKEKLRHIKQRLEVKEEINFELKATYVPSSKMVLTIKDLEYHYPNSERNIIDKFNFELYGPRRLAFKGPNGAGKSTLLQLIKGYLQPSAGTITLGVDDVVYLDQNIKLLKPELTLLENYQSINPDASDFESYSALAAFKFRNLLAKKLVANLSGGERIRAGLACTLLGQNPPQLVLLDEPTNHLDITSIETIEEAFEHYQGAMIIVSHDEVFLENIGIEDSIQVNSRREIG